MLKTTQLPTKLAFPKSAFTSPQECQATAFLLTCVCHARNDPSASSWSGLSQNCLSRALVMIRTPMPRLVHYRPHHVHSCSQNTNCQGQCSCFTNTAPLR